MPDRQIAYVTGLPRAGSTLLCQLLGLHQDIYSIGHSSPLAHALQKLRYNLSDDPFLLAQMDVEFDVVYQRLMNAYHGFINGWFAEASEPMVVDKNRAWLGMVETVQHLDPDFKMLVCVREPGQVYGSVEAQHQKTLLMDFPDHLANHSRYARADKLFKDGGVIGKPLRNIQALQDLPRELRKHIYFVVFERLMNTPSVVMQDIFKWLELPEQELDLDKLPTKPSESDSHYRFKYPHKTFSEIRKPQRHEIPQRIEQDIRKGFTWFYQEFYPGLLKKNKDSKTRH